MGVINDIASLVNQSIDVSISYFKENAVAIIALLFLWRYLRGGFNDRYPNGWSSEGYSLSSSSTESTTKQDSDRREEMRKARERQQKIADERAKEAAILRKEKEAKERKRKNQAALKKYPGDRLGDGRPTNNTSRSTSSSSSRLRSNDYNPMQPWNSGTSSYRPSRRARPGGGS